MSVAHRDILRGCLLYVLALCLVFSVAIADDCQPVTWKQAGLRTAATLAPTFKQHWSSLVTDGLQPGELNCRDLGRTYANVNYYSCTQLANKAGITIEKFFMLNPELKTDCSNIEPYTEYCVVGFIEPLRATDGLCGPPNKNATCRGTPMQCCNSETWRCGNSTEDCARGTCYEGICFGDRIYGTDGTCGIQNGNRMCARKWSDCCSLTGKCGTGPDFCGMDVCQSGNCTRPVKPIPGPPSYITGNTTDGTCGGEENYVCNVLFGNCCNKDGICGSLASDCGEGCQPQFGNCSLASMSITFE